MTECTEQFLEYYLTEFYKYFCKIRNILKCVKNLLCINEIKVLKCYRFFNVIWFIYF